MLTKTLKKETIFSTLCSIKRYREDIEEINKNCSTKMRRRNAGDNR
jgi:hypothetical protein